MNPRVSLLVLITFIFFSCGTDVKEEAPAQETIAKTLISEIDTFYGGNNLLIVADTTELAFNAYFNFKPDTSENNNIKKDARFVSRNNDTLNLKLDNGTIKKLVSDKNMESEDFSAYSYIGKLNDINYYLIFVSYYEAYQYLIVNAKTGKETYICGAPAVSPNKKYLLTSNFDLIAGFVYNGMEMYDVGSDSLKTNWKRELTKWGACDIAWIDDNTLVAKKQRIDSTTQNSVSSYVKITCSKN